jgi:hypothetical protein
MADPTQYDLVQDSRLDSLESLVTPQPKPTPGVEYSFPIVGQDLSDSEYRQMMLAQGNGILDRGGQPYWIRNADNATDTVQLTVSKTTENAEAVIAGFFHRLTADLTVSVPPVTASTDYHLCLTMDPLQSTNPAGPISVQLYAGTPPTTQGRTHIVLWKGTRTKNQLLSNVSWQVVRPKIAPTITVGYEGDLPRVQDVLWGTIAHVTRGGAGRFVYATGSDESGGPSQWKPIGDTGWVALPNPASGWSKSGFPAVCNRNGVIYLQGSFYNSGFTGGFTKILTMPKDFVPEYTVQASMGGNTNAARSMEIRPDGGLYAYHAVASSAYNNLSNLGPYLAAS